MKYVAIVMLLFVFTASGIAKAAPTSLVKSPDPDLQPNVDDADCTSEKGSIILQAIFRSYKVAEASET